MTPNLKNAMRALALLPVAALSCLPAAAAASTGGAGAPTASAPAAKTAHPAIERRTNIATWFGPGFYGHHTACGQTLTPEVVGIASRTLPCGTLVSVTYGARTVTVPVLDRGPYGHFGAEWDLTAGAASALGITETVRIHTHIVGTTANTPLLGMPTPPLSEASSAAAGGVSAG